MLLRSSPLLVAAAFAAMLSAQQDPPAGAPAATPPAAPPAAKARAEQPHFRALRWPADKDAAIAVVGTRTLTLTDLVDHLDGAGAVYGDALLGRLLHQHTDADGTQRAFWAVGEETVIEAVVPGRADSAEGRDHAANGEGVHAIVFATTDLDGAATFLRSKDQRLEPAGPDTVFVDGEDSFGLRVGFTRAAIPGDTRA